MVKLYTDCQLCPNYKGMSSDFKSMAQCTRVKGTTVLVSVMPSNWNKGIKNGVLIVDCSKK